MAQAKKAAAKSAANGPEPPAKKAKNSTTTAKGELVTFLSRMRDGNYKKRCSEDDRAQATDTLNQYNSLAQEEKASFALAYQTNKDAKTFQWAREFMQTVRVTKDDEEEAIEKYMTRISCLISF